VYSNQASLLLGVLLSHAFSDNAQKGKLWDESYRESPKLVVSLITQPLGMKSTPIEDLLFLGNLAQGFTRASLGIRWPQRSENRFTRVGAPNCYFAHVALTSMSSRSCRALTHFA